MNTCATCQWMQPYAPGKPEDGGECMFDPPVVAVVRNSVVTLRPSVLATDRCSAWEGVSAHAVVFDGKPRLSIFAVDDDDGWSEIKKKES